VGAGTDRGAHDDRWRAQRGTHRVLDDVGRVAPRARRRRRPAVDAPSGWATTSWM